MDYRMIVLLLFFFQIDNDLLREFGVSERDINSLNLGFKNISKEQHEEHLD